MVHFDTGIQCSKTGICQVHTHNSILTKGSKILHETQPILVLISYHAMSSTAFLFLISMSSCWVCFTVSEAKTAQGALAMISTVSDSMNTINPSSQNSEVQYFVEHFLSISNTDIQKDSSIIERLQFPVNLGKCSESADLADFLKCMEKLSWPQCVIAPVQNFQDDSCCLLQNSKPTASSILGQYL